MASTVTVHIRAATSGIAGSLRSLRSSIGGAVSSMVSSMGSAFASAGSSISQGLGQSLSSAGSNPYVLAGVTGLVGVLAPMLATLLGGAIILGVGGALAGIGIMAAMKAKSVQNAFSKMKDTIGKTLTEAAKPLEPVLIHVAKMVGDFAKAAGPLLKSIFTDMAPALQSFFDAVMKGFKAFAPALKPMATAFNGLIKALGPVFTKLLGDLGKAMGDLGKQFQQKDTIDAFVGVISAFFSLLPAGIKVITFLSGVFAQLWPSFKQLGMALLELGKAVGPIFMVLLQGYVKYIQILYPLLAKVITYIAQFIAAIVGNVPAAIGLIIDLVKWIGRIVGKTITFLQKGAQAVIDWAKGIINWVKNVKNKTVSFFQKGASTVIGWVKSAIDWIRNLKGKTVSILQRGAGGVVSAVGGAIGKIRSFVGKTVSIGVRGASAAISAVQGVINRIRNFVGKTVSIGVNFFKGAGSKLASALGFAHGGYVGAAASGGSRSNQVLVGERGPEIVDLAPGSRVRSHDSTRTMLSQGGQAPMQHYTIMIGNDKLGEFLIDPLKGVIRKRGGSVQAVLGT